MKNFVFESKLRLKKHKNITENCGISAVNPEEGELLTFLCQHPAKPIVGIGDLVLCGEKIAETDDASVSVYSSVSGTVKEIKQISGSDRSLTQAIIVENNGKMEECPPFVGIDSLSALTKEKFIDTLKQAGLECADFPAQAEYIIVDGTECGPYQTRDYRIMLERPQNIKSGLEMILELYPGARVIFAIETNKPKAIKAFQNIFKDSSQVKVLPLKPRYPHGFEKVLVKTCTGKEVPQGKNPGDIGIIVLGVSDLADIDAVVQSGRPVTRRVITLSGGAVKNPGNYEVCVGMNKKSFVDAVGGFNSPPHKIISGNAMTGYCLSNLDEPVLKTDSAILALDEAESVIATELPCIRCGRCIGCCPVRLLPNELNSLSVKKNYDGFVALNGNDCIECGSCSYICLSKRHLAHSIITAKSVIAIRERNNSHENQGE